MDDDGLSKCNDKKANPDECQQSMPRPACEPFASNSCKVWLEGCERLTDSAVIDFLLQFKFRTLSTDSNLTTFW